MSGNRGWIKSRNQTETEIQNMKKDEKEKKDPGHALKNVKPIAPVAIVSDIRPRFGRNYYSVHRVKNKRQKDAENFDKEQIRYVVNILHGVFKNAFAVHSFRVREHMNEKK